MISAEKLKTTRESRNPHHLYTMNIKQSTLTGLRNYVRDRVPPGDFLRAVLENNLSETFARGDDENLAAIHDIIRHVYCELPSACWGSPAKVAKWLETQN